MCLRTNAQADEVTTIIRLCFCNLIETGFFYGRRKKLDLTKKTFVHYIFKIYRIRLYQIQRFWKSPCLQIMSTKSDFDSCVMTVKSVNRIIQNNTIE